MQPSDDDFRPQTLPGQLREIWRRSGVGKYPRLASAVIGWAVMAMLVSIGLMAWHWGNANGWFSVATSGMQMWFYLLLYMLQDELIWLGSIHIVLWSQWRWPSPPSVRKFVLLAFLMSVVSTLLRYPPLLSSHRTEFLLITWSNHAIFLAWSVLLIRSASTLTCYQLVSSETDRTTAKAAQSWSLQGLFQATLLVAVTIVIERWIFSLQVENFQYDPNADFAWYAIVSLSYLLFNTIVLVYAAAAISAGRGFQLPVILIALNAVLATALWAGNTMLLPASVPSFTWVDTVLSWVLRVVIVVSLHLAAFRAWRWAGYSLRTAE